MLVAVGLATTGRVSPGVGLAVRVGVRLGVAVGVRVRVGLGVCVGVRLGVAVGIRVRVGLGVGVGVRLGVAIAVGVEVGLLALVASRLGAGVGVRLGVAGSVGVEARSKASVARVGGEVAAAGGISSGAAVDTAACVAGGSPSSGTTLCMAPGVKVEGGSPWTDLGRRSRNTSKTTIPIAATAATASQGARKMRRGLLPPAEGAAGAGLRSTAARYRGQASQPSPRQAADW